MKTNRLIQIIAGIIMIFGGIICIDNPIESDLLLMWIVVICMLINSVSSIFSWSNLRRSGMANGWSLAGSIISLIFAIFLLVNVFARFVLLTAIIYIVMAWMIINGIFQILAALSLKKVRNSGVPEFGQNWVLVLIFGILMIIAGLFGLARPLGIALAIGWIFGINLVVNGINLLVFSGENSL